MKIFYIFFTLIFFSIPNHTMAAWINDDLSIQKVNQDKVPQVNIHGKIQDSFNQDSFFPLIMYFTDMGSIGQPWTKFGLDSTKSRDTLPELQAAGFNASWPSWFTPTNQELDHAKTYGIKIIANLSNEITTLLTGGQTPEKISAFKSTIARLRDHSSVIAYHLFDEIPLYSSAQYQEVKKIIRSVDPGKIVLANHYNHGCDATFEDISNFGEYPVKSNTPTQSVMQTATSVKTTLEDGCPRPIWVIVQSFRDDKYFRKTPTPSELRVQIYTSIVHGATGIYAFLQHSPWAWNGKNGGEGYLENKEAMAGISPQVNGDLWQEISKINHEITTYNKVYLSQTSTDAYHLFKGTSNSVHTILKDTGESNTLYLLAVNLYNTPTSEKFVFATTLARVTSLLDNRNITSTGNEFIDNFTSFGVQLYRLSFGTTSSPTPSPSPSSSTSSIADLNGSGKVDIFDYNTFVSDYGKTGAPGFVPADMTKDGTINIFDYNLLVANFGK